jgi:hypothetical protein
MLLPAMKIFNIPRQYLPFRYLMGLTATYAELMALVHLFVYHRTMCCSNVQFATLLYRNGVVPPPSYSSRIGSEQGKSRGRTTVKKFRRGDHPAIHENVTKGSLLSRIGYLLQSDNCIYLASGTVSDDKV